MVAVAAVVGLPAVTWATGPGSQCEGTSTGTNPAATASDCEPAPDNAGGSDVVPTVVLIRAPTGAEGPTPADEGEVSEGDPAAGEQEQQPTPEPAPEPEAQPEAEPDAELPTVSGLSLSASATPEAVTPGSTVTFRITVHNAGPANDAGVIVLDAIPVGALVYGDVDGLDPSSGSLSLGAMAVGATRKVTIMVEMPPSFGDVVTSPQVAGQHSEALNVEHQDTVVVAVVPQAELSPVTDATAPQAPPSSANDIPAAEGDNSGYQSGDQSGDHSGDQPGQEPAEVSGDERADERGSPDATSQRRTSGRSLDSTDAQRLAPILGGLDHTEQVPTAGPLEQRSASPTDSALATSTGAVVDRVFTTPLELLGLALLATGGVLLAVGGFGPVRIRRR
jgi:uncharacterized repeat protein (TIGR01451 family)